MLTFFDNYVKFKKGKFHQMENSSSIAHFNF